MSVLAVTIVNTHMLLRVVGPGVNASLAITRPTAARIALVGTQGPAGVSSIGSHINDALPHPAYDDMADATLIFENGLV